jgi:polysaccharide pyruvyl transferase WcaK-like protein
MEYRPKCRDFMKTVKAEEQCLRCDKMTPQQLIDQVYFLYENGERIQKKQLSISNKFKAKIFNEMAIVLADINKSSN